jgi:hypothetical protein
MKKISILVITALLVISPLALFAKTAISDNDLEDVTAETGVSITFNNVTVVGPIGLTAASWGDSDGFTNYSSAGYAGMNGVSLTGNLTTLSNAAVIDVGTSGAITRVNIVMPTITLGTMNVDATMKLSGSKDLTGGNILGVVAMRGFSTQAIGAIQVFAH